MGCVGTLQFDVFQYRLKTSTKVDLVMDNLPYEYLRWVDAFDGNLDDDLVIGNGQDIKLVEDYQGSKLLLFSAPGPSSGSRTRTSPCACPSSAAQSSERSLSCDCISRHGRRRWNVRRLYQGHSDIPLNENGVALAESPVAASGTSPLTWPTSPPRPARRRDRPPGPGRPSGRGAQAHRDRLRRLRGLPPSPQSGPSSGPQSPQLHPGPEHYVAPEGASPSPVCVCG